MELPTLVHAQKNNKKPDPEPSLFGLRGDCRNMAVHDGVVRRRGPTVSVDIIDNKNVLHKNEKYLSPPESYILDL